MRRDAILTAVVSALDVSGLTNLLRPFYSGRGAVLAFHHVLPDGSTTLMPGNAVTVSQLRGILAYLRRRGVDFIHVSEIPARLNAGLSRRFVAFTLDDGYRDNFEHGLPVFREFGASFSVFPCTGFLNRTDILWSHLLEALCLRTDRVTWLHAELGRAEFNRAAGEDKLSFFRRIEGHAAYQTDIVACLAESCEAEGMAVAEIKDGLFLSWEQLGLLAQDPLATVGVHTVTHAALGTLAESEAKNEIGNSREELERRLGVPVTQIAYPFGSPGTCGSREFEMAQRSGFEIGFTTKRGNIYEHHRNSLLSLPRHTLSMTPHSIGTGYLRISLNGVWDTPLNGTVFTR